MTTWNPWHGCKEVSPGYLNCYIRRRDAKFGKYSNIITKTSSFDLPVRRDRRGMYKLLPDGGSVYICMTSDSFVEEADEWRPEAWKMIQAKGDLHLMIITKRVHRFQVGLPKDWGKGYDDVTTCCTCESQNRADYRLPIFLDLSIGHRTLIHKPILERIEIRRYLGTGLIEQITCGGESGPEARICDYAWILDTMQQYVEHNVPFWFKQAGAKFKKGSGVYHIERKDQMSQTEKAGVNYRFGSNMSNQDG